MATCMPHPGRQIAATVFVAIGLVAVPRLDAQSSAPPTAYSLTETNALMGPPETYSVYRDGTKAVIDITHPGESGGTRSLNDLTTHSSKGWHYPDAVAGCSNGTFSGDWGDPFAFSAEATGQIAKQGLKPVGKETIHGLETNIFNVPSGPATLKAWVDTKFGLLVKMMNGTTTMIEVTSFTVGAPPASTFQLPKTCQTLWPRP